MKTSRSQADKLILADESLIDENTTKIKVIYR